MWVWVLVMEAPVSDVASDLHDFTDSQEVSQSDVIAAQEGLPLEKHGLQLAQRLSQLCQSPLQFHTIYRRTRQAGKQHLDR